jgi:hypothetical protein
MEMDMHINKQNELIELREEILDEVLKIYFMAAEANGWSEPPKDVEETMQYIFRLVSHGLKIKE